MSKRPGRVVFSEAGFDIPDDVHQRWCMIFRGVDLNFEIGVAHCWCCDNPVKRPKSNFQSFLTRWLRRAFDNNLAKAPVAMPDHAAERAEIARLLGDGRAP